MRLRPVRLLALAATVGATGAAPPQPPAGVAITFLANEGVLLAAGPKRVLVDALFERYGAGYALPADSTRAALAAARPPFDGVGLVLVTHRHGDHFHPAPVAAHLRAAPQAVLLAAPQVLDSLRRLPLARTLAPRQLAPRAVAPGTRRRETIGGVAVEVLGIPHTGGARHAHVEHLGYVVELGGRRVLHVGDAEIDEAAFAPLRLDTARIDVALLPLWAVTSDAGRRVVARWIRPRQVVAIHVGAGEGPSATDAVRAAWPGAVTFARPLETRRW